MIHHFVENTDKSCLIAAIRKITVVASVSKIKSKRFMIIVVVP